MTQIKRLNSKLAAPRNLNVIKRPRLHPLIESIKQKRLTQVITDLEKHDYEFLKIEHHDRWPGFYRSDIRHWLKTAGVSNIIISTVSGGRCCAMSGRCYEKAEIDIFLATGTA